MSILVEWLIFLYKLLLSFLLVGSTLFFSPSLYAHLPFPTARPMNFRLQL